MAEKMQPNPQEPQEKQKKFFSSVVKKLSPLSAEDDIPANQSLGLSIPQRRQQQEIGC